MVVGFRENRTAASSAMQGKSRWRETKFHSSFLLLLAFHLAGKSIFHGTQKDFCRSAGWFEGVLVYFRWRIFARLVPCRVSADHTVATNYVKAPSAHGAEKWCAFGSNFWGGNAPVGMYY